MKLYGKNSVLERIKADPKSIKGLYLQKKTDLSGIVKAAKKAKLEFESVSKSFLDKKCGAVHSQGVMAEVDEFEYTPFSVIFDECMHGGSVPVLLDGIQDPQNLGSIIRNLACMGGFSLVIPAHNAAEVNETVLRVASGGENYIKIAKVTNLATTTGKLKEKEVWIAGAMAEDSHDVQTVELVSPMALVVGSEGKGVRPGIKKYIDERISLPMRGAQLSYNAAVAAALVCYEIDRRR